MLPTRACCLLVCCLLPTCACFLLVCCLLPTCVLPAAYLCLPAVSFAPVLACLCLLLLCLLLFNCVCPSCCLLPTASPLPCLVVSRTMQRSYAATQLLFCVHLSCRSVYRSQKQLASPSILGSPQSKDDSQPHDTSIEPSESVRAKRRRRCARALIANTTEVAVAALTELSQVQHLSLSWISRPRFLMLIL